jgi:hypothetical protein
MMSAFRSGYASDVMSTGAMIISQSLLKRLACAGYTGAERAQLENYLSGQKQVNAATPPTFIFDSYDDKVVNALNSTLFYQALVTARVPSEAHVFQKGTHGAGIAKSEPYEYVWPELFHNWLSEQGYIAERWRLIPRDGE